MLFVYNKQNTENIFKKGTIKHKLIVMESNFSIAILKILVLIR